MAELLKALTDVQTYLKTQQALLQNAGAFEACLKQQVDSWEQKFRSAKIDAVEAADLISALANGPWQTDQKARLSSSINDALIECSGTKGQRRPSQQVTNFGAYLTQMDLDALKSQASMIAKCEVLAARCCRLGLHLPSELTLRHIIAAATHNGLQAPSATDSFAALNELKKQLRLKRKTVPPPVPFLVSWPDKPEGSILTLYDEADPPVESHTDGTSVSHLSNNIALRKNSKMLAPCSTAMVLSGSSSSSALPTAIGNQGMASNPLLAFAAAFAQLAQGHGQAQSQASEPIPGLQFFKPKEKRSGGGQPAADSQDSQGSQGSPGDVAPASTLPLVAPPALAPPPPASPALGPAQPKPSESQSSMNQAILMKPEDQVAAYEAALKARETARQEWPVMKRPAAAPTKVQKSAPKVKAKQAPKAKASQTSKAKAKANKLDYTKKEAPLGCIRCRGASKGCDTCRNPGFKGQRFSGRADYNQWVASQKTLKGKVYK